jgi:hypothetical protein
MDGAGRDTVLGKYYYGIFSGCYVFYPNANKGDQDRRKEQHTKKCEK